MNKNNVIKMIPKIPLLDLFRIFICAIVFLFHAVIHKFWVIEKSSYIYSILSTGAIYMDAFFILSGFLLYYLYSDKLQNFSYQTIKDFYLKRIKRIYPHYIVSTIVMCVLIGIVLWAIPIEIFCLQGFYPQLFTKMGNGGTWFVSCLLFSYLLFPVLNKIVISTKKNFLAVILLYISLVYFVILGIELKIKWVAIYIHPLYRMLEFWIGMYVGKIFLRKQINTKSASLVAIISISLLFILIPILFRNNFVNHIKFAQNYLDYVVITIPLFSIIIYSLSCIKNMFVDIFCKIKFIKILTVLTFPFFIWQPVGQKITKDLIKAFSLNDYSFLLLFIITLALSVFAYINIDIVPKYIKNVLRGEKND